MRTSGKTHGPWIAVLLAVAPLACNAILGAGDYKVGQGGGSDGGEPMGNGGVSATGGAGHAAGGSAEEGAGGASASGGAGGDDTDSGAFAGAGNGGAGNGGAGAGGKAAGGTVGTGGATGTGGKATGGTGSGGKGTGGAGTGGATGATVAPFLGIWTATTGSQTVTCGRNTPTVTSLAGDTLDFEAGTTTDLEVYPSTSDCFVTADVSAKVATATKGQSCTYYSTTTGSVVAVDTYTTYTFTVGANGTTGTLQGSGNLAEVSPPMSCTYTVMASFTKNGGA